ncbi:MAG: glucosidase, partial [Actinobacteria bacterium]|nr:glucosidase [Actinomycetota bacterium]
MPEAPSREAARLAEDPCRWSEWGPYLAERAWGTVREDYSTHGNAWDYVSHDKARSQAFRWNEDGMAGICDDHQILCLAFGFWNGVDPMLKERIFGLTGNEGNHGEDAKEYWWYVDSTPSHSWMVWRYIYPQSEFPYRQLVEENARRGRLDPEFELFDTGVLDSGYWDISIEYAKHSPDDMSIRLTARNRGESVAELHVL